MSLLVTVAENDVRMVLGHPHEQPSRRTDRSSRTISGRAINVCPASGKSVSLGGYCTRYPRQNHDSNEEAAPSLLTKILDAVAQAGVHRIRLGVNEMLS